MRRRVCWPTKALLGSVEATAKLNVPFGLLYCIGIAIGAIWLK